MDTCSKIISMNPNRASSGSVGAWWVLLAALGAGGAPHLTGLPPRGEGPRGERPVGLLPRGEAPVGRPPVT